VWPWNLATSCNIDVTPRTLTATDTCIGYHVTRFEASRNVILHTRYVSTCVGAGCGMGRGTKIQTKVIRCRACYFWTYYMYKSSLRHIHDPVLSSLKMKGVRLLFIPMFLNCSSCFGWRTVHHQELKNCKWSLWFYVRFWLPAAAMAEPSQRPATKNVCKTRGCNYSFWAPDDGRFVRNTMSN
jgi:hypothetical protein